MVPLGASAGLAFSGCSGGERRRRRASEEGVLLLVGGNEYNHAILGTSIAVTSTGLGGFLFDHAIGWPDMLSGPWVLGTLVLAILIGFVTLLRFGRDRKK